MPYVVPLLDRLVDETPHAGDESVPKRTCSINDYQRSVLRDVLDLLNTRVSRVDWLKGNSMPTVLDYGLPDLGGKMVESQIDAERLAKLVTQAIRAFEPRLENVQVNSISLPEFQQKMSLSSRSGQEMLHSSNIMLGTVSPTDFAGQETARQHFRLGLHIKAGLKGTSGRMSLSFPVKFDSQGTAFCEEEKCDGKS